MAMTPKEIIAVVQHFDAGGEVEYSPGNGVWNRSTTPVWNFEEFDYRPKHKPLELWVNVYPEPRSSVPHAVYTSEDDAIRFRGANGRTVHMREVVDEDS